MILPIEPILPALLAELAAGRCAVLEAPPGAGKTTRVPLALLDASWLAGRKLILLEPRRLAARAAAVRMATTLEERVGETVGYRMRLDTRVGPRTRIEVVTEGVLTRMLQHDLALDGVGLVIFDEFHERSLASDTGLALTIAAASLRDDLRILVMSATLDGVAVAKLLGEAPVVRGEGRAWPVETRHVPPRVGQPQSTGYQRRAAFEAHVAAVVRGVVATEAGSVLVFLPGAGEIRRVEELLRGALPSDVVLQPLHGSLPIEAQDAAIAPAPPGRRKVVLATSIAETSLTIEGIRVVVDGGLMRVPRFSAGTGMTRLETVRVSRASADQRRGRAGRIEPGVCIRCWSIGEDAGLVPYTRPEMLDADLAPLALDLVSAGFPDPGELRWLDPPPAAALGQARELLQLLGALDPQGRITAHGKAIAELGVHPRLAHLMLRAVEASADTAATATALVAILDERDLLRGVGGPPPADVQLRLDAVARDIDEAMLGGATMDRGLVHRTRDVAAEWRRRLAATKPRTARPGLGDRPGGGETLLRPAQVPGASVGMMLAWAYPDRVAQRREVPGRFLLRNGRGAVLPLADPLAQAEWIVAAQIDDTGRDGRITLAARLDPAELLAHAAEQIATVDEISWNEATRSVQARRRTMLGAVVLSDSAIPDVDPERIAAALLDGIMQIGIGVLPWSDAATSLRQRLAFLHHGDAAWPDMSDEALGATLTAWLGPHVAGVRKLDDLSRADLGGALRSLLTWEQRRQLDDLAPERLEVPSGSHIAVDYRDPAAPSLAVRLQEIFGWTDTPRLGGRVAVTLQLLSPAYRPVQVTRDLASFWAAGYFDVRRDLRGRYPKHHWPDDPTTALAVRGAKRRARPRE